MLRYNYTVINTRSNDSLVTINNGSLLMELDFSVQNDDSLNVLLRITDDANQFLDIVLFENIIGKKCTCSIHASVPVKVTNATIM